MSEPAQVDISLSITMTPDESQYVVTLDVGQDNARMFDDAQALAYAAGVLEACARAEYDAAVLRQLTKTLEVGIDEVGIMVADLRHARPELDHSRTAPFILFPGVNIRMHPFIRVEIGDKEIGQWEIADARHHAMMAIEAVAIAKLDTGYLAGLHGPIGLDVSTSRKVVGDLINYRKEAKGL